MLPTYIMSAKKILSMPLKNVYKQTSIKEQNHSTIISAKPKPNNAEVALFFALSALRIPD